MDSSSTLNLSTSVFQFDNDKKTLITEDIALLQDISAYIEKSKRKRRAKTSETLTNLNSDNNTIKNELSYEFYENATERQNYLNKALDVLMNNNDISHT